MPRAGRVLFGFAYKVLLVLFTNLGSVCRRMAEFATVPGEESLEDLVTLLFSQIRTAPEGWSSELSSDVDPAILDIFLQGREGGIAGSDAPADSGATAVVQTTAAPYSISVSESNDESLNGPSDESRHRGSRKVDNRLETGSHQKDGGSVGEGKLYSN